MREIKSRLSELDSRVLQDDKIQKFVNKEQTKQSATQPQVVMMMMNISISRVSNIQKKSKEEIIRQEEC
jgi:hypothetical protein